ncbi:MAG: hypothetical protein JWO20_1665 [Candidatus Angelobacter sp.]|jgi:hypothetical protein|nr:hypothetical protein [Candidatus Angelobacter sp.]
MPAPAVTTVLQVAYEGSLLVTRGAILEERGYRVISVLGNKNAFKVGESVIGQIHVVLVGHCAPISVRREAIKYFKERHPALCVLALNSSENSGRLEEADFNSNSDDPEQLLNAVAVAVASICK